MENEKCDAVWTDGCYDMIHYGHANQLRQAKSMGKILVAGIHTDEEISQHKSKPIMNLEERVTVLQSIRWVDKVVVGAPYITYPHTLDQYNCSFCVHGDDCTFSADGKDTYYLVKSCARYRECRRTKGVSTTDLIDRILNPNSISLEILNQSPEMQNYHQLLLGEFCRDLAPPCHGANVCLLSGSFDILHPAVIKHLESFKSQGYFVLVGVVDDQELKDNTGHYPILNNVERKLSLLACKYVDWVVGPLPFIVPSKTIEEYHVSMVGKCDCDYDENVSAARYKEIDPRIVSTNRPPIGLSSAFLRDRVTNDKDEYIKKVNKKRATDPGQEITPK